MTTDIAASLKQHFGFSSFRLGQVEAIQSLLDNRNTLVVMPTGSGKSLVFQLAALLLPGLTIVISPLVALMKDQVDQLRGRGIDATFINSSLEPAEQANRIRNLSAGKYRILYIAPERLRSTQFLNTLKAQKISLLAVDEAHCISEWGHDFRPDFLQIANFREALQYPLTVALTATATPRVQDEIVRLLKLTQVQRVVTGFNRSNLTFKVSYITDINGRLRALQTLLTNKEPGGTILYTGTRRDAEEIADFVSTVVKKPSVAYHAGLPPAERSHIQDLFMSGKISVVAATNAFGMGIDRADVRQVIHYSIPGSLEAYYQEAGRAGRDGLPANVILFFDPKDRALQEWFIKQSQITQKDLKKLYDVLPSDKYGSQFITTDDLSARIGLHPVAIKLGLAALEYAGALERSGDEGIRMFGRKKAWNQEQVQSTIAHFELHQRHRTSQLEKMVTYAESNQCRRRIILNHFGDTGPSTADNCCDNCQAHHRPAGSITSAPTQKVTKVASTAPVPPTQLMPAFPEAEGLPQPARVALILLDTLRRLVPSMGREKVIKILKGSQAKEIAQYGYDKFVYYGKLAVLSHDELQNVIQQLASLGLLKSVGSEYPVLKLTPAGETAIREKSVLPVTLSRQYSARQIELKNASLQAGGTVELTAQMLEQGLSVGEIASQRNLVVSTIYGHCAKLISAERLQIEIIIPDEVRKTVEEAISKVGSVEYLSPILNLLSPDVNPSLVRCVVEKWKLNHPSGSPDIQTERLEDTSDSSVEEFLSHPHPRALPGPWKMGLALDYYSRYNGSDWQRTTTGDLVHRLKYENDLTALPLLVIQAASMLAEHPELKSVDAIIPVPPSVPHPSNPVILFTEALAKHLNLPYLSVVVKTRQTAQQKEMHTLAQKKANLIGAFKLQSPVHSKRLLVVDDLFDSGVTMHEITKLLLQAGAASVCIMTFTRTIHSDD